MMQFVYAFYDAKNKAKKYANLLIIKAVVCIDISILN